MGVWRYLRMIKNQGRTSQRDPHPIPPHKGEGAKALARDLRRNATPAERALWQQLRLLRAEGRHFRRQVPIGRFIADFASHHPKLVIELDGGQHATEQGQEADRLRSAQLASHGFRVLRFWNTDVFTNIEGIVDMIRNACGLETTFEYREAGGGAAPTPNHSPQGGGE